PAHPRVRPRRLRRLRPRRLPRPLLPRQGGDRPPRLRGRRRRPPPRRRLRSLPAAPRVSRGGSGRGEGGAPDEKASHADGGGPSAPAYLSATPGAGRQRGGDPRRGGAVGRERGGTHEAGAVRGYSGERGRTEGGAG